MELSALNIRDAGQIEHDVAAFAQSSNGGLIVTAGQRSLLHRDLLFTLAARHKLPAVYFQSVFVAVINQKNGQSAQSRNATVTSGTRRRRDRITDMT